MYTVFQIIGAIIGVLSMALLGLLRTMMWHGEDTRWGATVTVQHTAQHQPYAMEPASYAPRYEPRYAPQREVPRLTSPYGGRQGGSRPPSPQRSRGSSSTPTSARRGRTPRSIRLDPARNPYLYPQPIAAPPPIQHYQIQDRGGFLSPNRRISTHSSNRLVPEEQEPVFMITPVRGGSPVAGGVIPAGYSTSMYPERQQSE